MAGVHCIERRQAICGNNCQSSEFQLEAVIEMGSVSNPRRVPYQRPDHQWQVPFLLLGIIMGLLILES